MVNNSSLQHMFINKLYQLQYMIISHTWLTKPLMQTQAKEEEIWRSNLRQVYQQYHNPTFL